MKTQPLQFLRHGQVIRLPAVETNRTLLEVLREDLGCTGTKEGCNEGDCGACTVVLGEAGPDGLQYRAVNSCIRMAHSINNLALWTVEDVAPTLHRSRGSRPPEGAHFALGRPGDETVAPTLHRSRGSRPPEGAHFALGRPGDETVAPTLHRSRGSLPGDETVTWAASPSLHPAQQAMVDCHGSQCGFCTPGFVMSLFGLYQTCKGQAVSRDQAQAALSGNLCRCTGYRPILDAAQSMHTLPPVLINESEVLSKLELLRQDTPGLQDDLAYKLPQNLLQLLLERSRHPEAQIVAGCTDVGLWVTKQHRQFDAVLDLTRVAELRRVEDYPHHLAIGAAVTLNDAFTALVAQWPQLDEFARRFAGLSMRNSGTLGGNVANGSPIGDSMPLLIAMGANVVLMAWREKNGKERVVHRELRLEDLYTGYRQNVIAPDEVLAWIKVPKPVAAASVGANMLRVYKISKRFEDDISAVCLALDVAVVHGVVQHASIGVGGVAATPVRAKKTEAALLGQAWTLETVQRTMEVLRAEFAPISDMRATAAYRRTVLGNLLQRYWLERQGDTPVDLRQLHTLEVAQ